jgi:hypothetical protein
LAGFSLFNGWLPGAAKLDKGLRPPPPSTEPKLLAALPNEVAKPLDGFDARPANGDALLPPPNVSLGGAAGCAVSGLFAEAKPAFLLGLASDANGDAPAASFPKPEAANADDDVVLGWVASEVLEDWFAVDSEVPAAGV